MDRFYAKFANDPTYWLVEDGQRRQMDSMAEVYAVGLLPVRVLSWRELHAIPEEGSGEGVGSDADAGDDEGDFSADIGVDIPEPDVSE